MSAEQLSFTNYGVAWLTFKTEGNKFIATEADGRSWEFDRGQAQLLKLWLEEHLTSNTKKLKDALGDMWLRGCGLYHQKDYVCERLDK